MFDVRSDDEDEVNAIDNLYKKHVLHILFDQLNKMKESLPASKPLLIICRGKLCVMSNESTFQLKKWGFDAYKFDYSWYYISRKLVEG